MTGMCHPTFMCKTHVSGFSIDFRPISRDFWEKSLLNLSEIKIHFTLNVQYEGKVTTNQRTIRINTGKIKRCKCKTGQSFRCKLKSCHFLAENLNSETAFTRCRYILKTVKNVTDRVHTKTAHFMPANFENGRF